MKPNGVTLLFLMKDHFRWIWLKLQQVFWTNLQFRKIKSQVRFYLCQIRYKSKIRNHNLLSKYLCIIAIIIISVQTWLHVCTCLKRTQGRNCYVIVYVATVGRVSRKYKNRFLPTRSAHRSVFLKKDHKHPFYFFLNHLWFSQKTVYFHDPRLSWVV